MKGTKPMPASPAYDSDPATIERTVLTLERDLEELDAFIAAGATHFIYRPGMQAPLRFDEVEGMS